MEYWKGHHFCLKLDLRINRLEGRLVEVVGEVRDGPGRSGAVREEAYLEVGWAPLRLEDLVRAHPTATTVLVSS